MASNLIFGRRRLVRSLGILNLIFLTAVGPLVLAGPETDLEKQRYDQAMAALNGAKDAYGRWCALDAAAKESFNQGRDAEAKALAEEMEQLAPTYAKDWNYGNAVQDFNLVLGRLALKTGDLEGARKHLVAAGASKGSPQMDTFGPNMSLAKDLLAKGDKEVVLGYFEQCRKFWEMQNGRLDQWVKDVQEGRTPDFGPNLSY